MQGFILKFKASISMLSRLTSTGTCTILPVPISLEIDSTTFFCVGFGFWSMAKMYGNLGFFSIVF